MERVIKPYDVEAARTTIYDNIEFWVKEESKGLTVDQMRAALIRMCRAKNTDFLTPQVDDKNIFTPGEMWTMHGQ